MTFVHLSDKKKPDGEYTYRNTAMVDMAREREGNYCPVFMSGILLRDAD